MPVTAQQLVRRSENWYTENLALQFTTADKNVITNDINVFFDYDGSRYTVLTHGRYHITIGRHPFSELSLGVNVLGRIIGGVHSVPGFRQVWSVPMCALDSVTSPHELRGEETINGVTVNTYEE